MIGAIVAGGLSAPTAPVTNSWESIQTFTVGSGGSSSIDFTVIPSTYKHLQIRWLARNASNSPYQASAVFLRMNNDTSSTYWNHGLYGNGSSAGAFSQSNTGYMNIIEAIANDASANIFSAGVLDILDYADTNKNKTVRSFFGVDKNGSGGVSLYSGSWGSTSAINRLTLIPQTSPFQQYSSFALYGIKG
jgi:hypothetical protein